MHAERGVCICIECPCVFPRAPSVPDGCEFTLRDTRLEGQVSLRASGDRPACSRHDGSENPTRSAAAEDVLAIWVEDRRLYLRHCRARWSSRWAGAPTHMLSRCCAHALEVHS